MTVLATAIGVKELTIPVFTGVIGYITNWTGVLMLFAPLKYHGVRIPGLKTLAPFLPKKALLVPLGLGQGKFGWLMPPEEIHARASVGEVTKALPPPDAR
jgi:uncharacterized membrane protein YheB (UPF0754 family)